MSVFSVRAYSGEVLGATAPARAESTDSRSSQASMLSMSHEEQRAYGSPKPLSTCLIEGQSRKAQVQRLQGCMPVRSSTPCLVHKLWGVGLECFAIIWLSPEQKGGPNTVHLN